MEKEKEMKSNKEKIIKHLFLIVGLLILILILLGIHRNDCYYFHVQECKNCHEQGLGFSVCSGFCFNSTDMGNYCHVDLTEKCESNIAHGCNLPENEYIDGWCVPFTEWCLYG